MQLLKLIFKTLFSGRIKYIIYFSIFTFVLSLIVGLLPEWLHPAAALKTLPTVAGATVQNTLPAVADTGMQRTCFNVLSNILLGIGSSILAAGLITTFEAININRVNNLIKLFSLDTTKKTAIVIPQFDKKYFEEKEEGGGENIPKTKDEITFISYADFNTAKYLVALFQDHNLGLPEIITDDEALSIIGNDEKVKKYHTFISLGLYSNKFSKAINDQELANRYFNFTARSISKPGDRQVKFLQPLESGREVWQQLTPNNQGQGCCDLCLFSKLEYNLPFKKTISITIAGGLNATGTYLLGDYLHTYWSTLLTKLEARNKSYQLKPIINSKNFCMIFKVNGDPNVRYDEKATMNLDPYPSRI